MQNIYKEETKMDYEIKEIEERFILVKDEKEIGYLKYTKDLDDDYIIESIYIEETYRGDGYAKMLFNEFIEEIKKRGRKITPICSYAQAQFQKRKDIQEMLKNL